MKIYISYLSHEVTEQDLFKTLEYYGQVESVMMRKERSRKGSKMTAIVEMPDRAEAELVILSLNGKNLKGKPIKVGFSLSGSKGHREHGQKGGSRRSAGDKVGGTRSGKRNF